MFNYGYQVYIFNTDIDISSFGLIKTYNLKKLSFSLFFYFSFFNFYAVTWRIFLTFIESSQSPLSQTLARGPCYSMGESVQAYIVSMGRQQQILFHAYLLATSADSSKSYTGHSIKSGKHGHKKIDIDKCVDTQADEQIDRQI